jgi:chromosome segregation ATPase
MTPERLQEIKTALPPELMREDDPLAAVIVELLEYVDDLTDQIHALEFIHAGCAKDTVGPPIQELVELRQQNDSLEKQLTLVQQECTRLANDKRIQSELIQVLEARVEQTERKIQRASELLFNAESELTTLKSKLPRHG